MSNVDQTLICRSKSRARVAPRWFGPPGACAAVVVTLWTLAACSSDEGQSAESAASSGGEPGVGGATGASGSPASGGTAAGDGGATGVAGGMGSAGLMGMGGMAAPAGGSGQGGGAAGGAPGSGGASGSAVDGGSDGGEPIGEAATWTTFAMGFMESYCVSCHPNNPLSERDYTLYEEVSADAERIRCGVSPVALDGCGEGSPVPGQFPIGSGPFPSDSEREALVAWIDAGMPQ